MKRLGTFFAGYAERAGHVGSTHTPGYSCLPALPVCLPRSCVLHWHGGNDTADHLGTFFSRTAKR